MYQSLQPGSSQTYPRVTHERPALILWYTDASQFFGVQVISPRTAYNQCTPTIYPCMALLLEYHVCPDFSSIVIVLPSAVQFRYQFGPYLEIDGMIYRISTIRIPIDYSALNRGSCNLTAVCLFLYINQNLFLTARFTLSNQESRWRN